MSFMELRKSSKQKKIFENTPKNQEHLAEIVGIMLGDGGIYLDKSRKYQLTISFNKNEVQYLLYVKNLTESYFYPYRFGIVNMKTEFFLRNISVHMTAHLLDAGLKVGDKTKLQVAIPAWIFDKKAFLIRCIRGLFDTDGCVYKKFAQYAQIQFKFSSYPLISSVRQALILLGFSPTQIESEQNKKFLHLKFYLSRQQEIMRFFEIIRPKNFKHVSRFRKIKWGRCDLNADLAGWSRQF